MALCMDGTCVYIWVCTRAHACVCVFIKVYIPAVAVREAKVSEAERHELLGAPQMSFQPDIDSAETTLAGRDVQEHLRALLAHAGRQNVQLGKETLLEG